MEFMATQGSGVYATVKDTEAEALRKILSDPKALDIALSIGRVALQNPIATAVSPDIRKKIDDLDRQLKKSR
jgi:hypothetical protein